MGLSVAVAVVVFVVLAAVLWRVLLGSGKDYSP